jgi:hypothetical protein
MHALEPATAAYEPTAHAEQLVVPVVSALYAPAAQSTHVDPLVYEPGAQDVQKSILKAPAALKLPTGHAVHASTPFEASLYVPTAHSAHDDAPVVAPYLPASHTAQLPAPVVNELYWPTAHAVHDSCVVEPPTSLYAPAAHAVHPLEPERVLYVPTPHCTHAADDVGPVTEL